MENSIRVYVSYNYRGIRRELLVFKTEGDQTYHMKNDPVYRDERWVDQWWLGLGLFAHPAANPNFEGIMKTPEQYFSKTTTPELAELENDFKSALKDVSDRTDKSLDSFGDFDRQTRMLRDEMAMIVQRGISQDDPDVKALADFVSSAENLPDASAWAKSSFNNAIPQTTMQGILDRTMRGLDALIEKVAAKNDLKPGNDMFAITLKQLKMLKDTRPGSKLDGGSHRTKGG